MVCADSTHVVPVDVISGSEVCYGIALLLALSLTVNVLNSGAASPAVEHLGINPAHGQVLSGGTKASPFSISGFHRVQFRRSQSHGKRKR